MSTKKNLKTGAEDLKWDLSDLYSGADDKTLQADKKAVFEDVKDFAETYHNSIKKLDVPAFKRALVEYEAIIEKVGKIGSFAHLLWAADTSDPSRGKLMQQANEFVSAIQQKLVFFELEWLNLDDEDAQEMIESEELSHYRHYLEASRRYKEYTLSEKEEQILSAKAVTGRNAWNRFFDETMGDARFELDGDQLTQQQALSKLHNPDRELRERAHESLTATFSDMSHRLTFVFNTILADKQTDDRLRKYPTWISARNLANEIKDQTVETLIHEVADCYGLVHRFYQLKKELLGYDHFYDYDRYAPLLENPKTVSWDEARATVKKTYEDFHPEMGAIVSRFFSENWIDAALRPGKRGGAFAASTVPSVHPYVLLNYDGKIRDVQTLAHELGHGIHQYLSRGQGVLQADTPLTTAETASVFGEMLVFQKLIAELDDHKEQLALLMSKIDDTVATVFRQVSMNRFEEAIHSRRREAGELTTEEFSALWRETQQNIYGNAVELTEGYDIWWSYIPHFLHTPGYVYAYAFGELLVLALYEEYQQHKNGFSETYIEMLRAGGADWPENIVAKTGLDITHPDFWNQGLAAIENMIEQAESLANQTNI
jgi:oligoendopeptidase F